MLLAPAQKGKAPERPERTSAARLSPLEREVIDWFVQLARLLGLPGSVAEVYGLLFLSGRPLTMDQCIERLDLSRGSACTGLRFLQGLGAVRVVYVAGQRPRHYEAVAELRNVAVRFARERVLPHLDGREDRAGRMAGLVMQCPPEEREHAARRVKLLQSWEKNTRRFLPLVVKILGR